jgi:hypothetical protein
VSTSTQAATPVASVAPNHSAPLSTSTGVAAAPTKAVRLTNPTSKSRGKRAARTLASAVVTTDPFDFDIPVALITSSCTGDTVSLAGEINAQIHTVVTDGGLTHFTITVKYDGVVGTSTLTGKKFISDTVAMAEATIAAGNEDTSVLSGRFLVTGESAGLGLGDDFFMYSTVHNTVTPGGVPTATVSNVRAGCQ